MTWASVGKDGGHAGVFGQRFAPDLISVKVGANGTLYWDEFESRRLTYIGP